MQLLEEIQEAYMDTFEEIFETINALKVKNQDNILKQAKTSEPVMNLDGVLFNTSTRLQPLIGPNGQTGGPNIIPLDKLNIHSYHLAIDNKPGSNHLWVFTLTVTFSTPNVQISDATFEVRDKNSPSVIYGKTGGADRLDSYSDNRAVMIFFYDNPLDVDTSENEIEITVQARLMTQFPPKTIPIDGVLKKMEKTSGGGGSGGGTTPPNSDSLFKNINRWGISRLGIGDYMKVTETLCRYVPGEVAHIENVMAKEYREKFSRRFRATEQTELTENSYETEQMTDTVSSERFESSREMSKIQQQSSSFTNNTNIEFKGGKIAPKINTSFGIAFHNNREQSNRQSSAESRELSQQVMHRIVTRKREERTFRMLDEFTEENRHGFDNRKGGDHVSGVYRWVDRIYKHTLLNYGKRMMMEFMIPEPASLHKRYMEDSDMSVLIRPLDPRVPKDDNDTLIIKDHQQINNTNYAYWVAQYNAEATPPPPEKIVSGKSYSVSYYKEQGYGKAAHLEDFEVPEGYELSEMKYSFMLEKHETKYDPNRIGGTFSVGGVTSSFVNIVSRTNHYDSSTLEVAKIGKNSHGRIPVAITTHDIGGVALTLNATFNRTNEKYEEWQILTFRSIIEAYEKAMMIYEDKVAQINQEQKEKLSANSRYYRQIEEKVLKKNCISYLYEQLGSKDFSFISKGSFSEHKVNRNEKLDEYARMVKFMEQAFEWEMMTYIFYPFYWGEQTSWKGLYHYTCDDPLFKSFMESGFARVIVTVRPGFEDAVTWYMQTAQVWDGKDAPVMNDEEYYSALDDIIDQEPKEVDQWEVRIPSSLTILQAGSTGLETSAALPNLCDPEFTDTLLKRPDVNLGNVVDNEENPEGGE